MTRGLDTYSGNKSGLSELLIGEPGLVLDSHKHLPSILMIESRFDNKLVKDLQILELRECYQVLRSLPESVIATERFCALQARFGTRNPNLSLGGCHLQIKAALATNQEFQKIVSLEANNIQEGYITTTLYLKKLSTRQYAKTQVEWMKSKLLPELNRERILLSKIVQFQGEK
ncbi:hypothetical protein PPACK8108_LOCUS6378 [Phakopsora pachyrhizi]|uniref:Uncharacterized protein n=1 Tax=Phakopsora pachyrhizi TaxID=170000 RepID=A0AAV0AQS9_PHAPC|nr:hypothetical protein PPACK8108_LOCUS6378 [Phakopsora pachyrhizi]